MFGGKNKMKQNDINRLSKEVENIEDMLEDIKSCFNEEIDFYDTSFEKALELSRKFKIPLHPNFIFYWNQIKKEEFLELIEWIKNSVVRGGKLIFPYTKNDKEKFKQCSRKSSCSWRECCGSRSSRIPFVRTRRHKTPQGPKKLDDKNES